MSNQNSYDTKFNILSKYLTPLYILLGFLVIFVIFSTSLVDGLRLWLAFLVVVYVPGYALADIAFKRYGDIAVSVLAPFIGLGVTPVISYFLSAFGVRGVTVIVAVVVAILALAIVYILDFRLTDHARSGKIYK